MKFKLTFNGVLIDVLIDVGIGIGTSLVCCFLALSPELKKGVNRRKKEEPFNSLV